jgi:hypothetical protein
MKIHNGAIILLMAICCVSCHKGEVNPGPISAFTLINVAINSSPVIPEFGTGQVQWFNTAQTVPYGSFFEYSLPSGQTQVSITQHSDTSVGIFNGSLMLAPRAIYSMFLCGQIQSVHGSPDTLFVEDFPPYYGTDSVAGVRFVNLMQEDRAISVNLVGNSNGSEISNLPFKGLSAFKAYSATSQNTSYSFEVRDAVSGDLLASYTYGSIATFQNVTIVIYGSSLPGTSSPMACLLVNDY